jgi:PAS domain S-box-containing protein
MTLQFVPAVVFYIISAIVIFVLCFVIWRTRPEHGRLWLMVMLCAGFWTTANALETFVTDLDTKLKLITALPYFGITGVIFFWSLFTITYSHHEHWLNKTTVTLLAIMPITTYLMVLTGRSHTLFWQSYWLIEKNGLFFFDGQLGIWFWIWAVYAYVVILGGSVLLITAVIRSPRLYQGQAIMLILGGLFPLISNFLFIIKVNPIAPLDLSPIGLTLSGIFMTIGLVRFRLFSIVPIAHDLVFKSVNSGVIMIDLQGHIIDVNPAAEQILHRSRDSIVGQDIRTALPDYATIMQAFQDTWDVKTEIALPPGPRVYELQLMPLTNRSGKMAGRLILLYDITERKQALAERDRLISDLDAYAHTVAHDLKNPLSVVVGYSGFLLEQETLSGREHKALQAIAQTGDKITEIIDSLLLLARVRNMETVEVQPLDTAVLIQSAWNRLMGSSQAATIELIAPETWPTAVGYAPWIEQVWVNYLSNAIKYGGQPPHVEIGAEVASNGHGTQPAVRFWVRDNGKGLSEEEAAQLFQKFARLDQHSSVQGHGLGLSIVQRIVEKLGGTVGVRSELGVGSTFYFMLPLAETEPFVKTAVISTPIPSPTRELSQQLISG